MSLRFFEIVEAKHRIQNPLSEDKLMLVGEICDLQPGQRQLDLASGQGEMLCRWAARYGSGGHGVDISPVFVDIAKQRAFELNVAGRVTFQQGDAAHYKAEPAAYDIVSCIGATWIGSGTAGTLDLMRPSLKPGGLLLVGEVFWRKPPTDVAAAALGFKPDEYSDLGGLLDVFNKAGVTLVEMVVSNQDDWDRYEARHWIQAERWLKAHPDHEDADPLREWIEASKHEYLNYGRDYLGWGIFVLTVKE